MSRVAIGGWIGQYSRVGALDAFLVAVGCVAEAGIVGRADRKGAGAFVIGVAF